MRRGVISLVATCLLLFPAPNTLGLKKSTKKLPEGLSDLSRELIVLESKIIEKLVADVATWKTEARQLESAVRGQLSVASVERNRLERAALALDLREPFESPEARRAVLLQLAALSLAGDELAQAQLAQVRRLEANRAKILTGLIQLMRKIVVGQKELLAYLEDPSLRKKLGQVDIGLLAATVVEARQLRAALADEPLELDFDIEKQRIQDRLTSVRELLSLLEDIAITADDTEGTE